jgi:hypothetical protein
MGNTLRTGRDDRPLAEKSTLDEIRARFDNDAERLSRLETGQQAAIDAPLIREGGFATIPPLPI